VHRLFSAPGIVFRGSGWYVNDSRKPGSSASLD
jgi:predicted nucleic acid-binding Zn ribbon protein